MIKQAIQGWNAAPGAPPGWQPEKSGECGALPIRVTMHKDGTLAYCESAWQPTPDELRLLNEGGNVILRVCCWQVPVALYVAPALIDEDAVPA